MITMIPAGMQKWYMCLPPPFHVCCSPVSIQNGSWRTAANCLIIQADG